LTAAILIFALSYLLIAGQRLPWIKLDRPAAALCGAVAMVAAGVIDFEGALAAVDLHVLSLLLGVMVVAGYLGEAGFFRYAAWWILTRARSARSLLWGLVFVSGGLSALLVNDTICLVFTPLVVAVVSEARLPSRPYLLALAAAANVGGVVSFTGNPQNMIIGTAAAGKLTYLGYLARALPIGVACLAVVALAIGFMFRGELAAAVMGERSAPKPHLDQRECQLGLAGLALFVVLVALGVPLAAAALAAAAACMLSSRVPARMVLARLDWALLLFFAGLFVLVAGLGHAGALAFASEQASDLAGRPGGTWLFGLAAVIGSNVISNVPYVVVAVRWVERLPDPTFGYVVLAVSSTLAGNLTLVGSVANVIVFEAAGPRGDIGMWRFMRYGVPITIATMVVAAAILAVERSLGF
jgi:Na+/H+ antiporter NhaD/arsenite permease-like protein